MGRRSRMLPFDPRLSCGLFRYNCCKRYQEIVTRVHEPSLRDRLSSFLRIHCCAAVAMFTIKDQISECQSIPVYSAGFQLVFLPSEILSSQTRHTWIMHHLIRHQNPRLSQESLLFWLDSRFAQWWVGCRQHWTKFQLVGLFQLVILLAR